MAALKRRIARKAVKSTAKHTAHGTISKLQRNPMRAGTLLVIGGAVGVLVGWIIGRSGDAAGPSPS